MSVAKLSPVDLFSMYMQVAGVPTLTAPPCQAPTDPALLKLYTKLKGKKLGIVNGSAWIALWSYYFGRKILPGVRLINVGNEAVQLSFMLAHSEGRPCPPKSNVDAFVRYAEDLVELFGVDAVLISCSTMNRSAGAVRDAMATRGVPVVPIDEPMMEEAVRRARQDDGRVLVVATHGPTVESTRRLLEETAARAGRELSFSGATVEEAFELLGRGDIEGHNEVVARAIREACAREEIAVVVLAQLSMTVFKLSYPDCRGALGVDVLTSGELGFQRVRDIFLGS